MCVCNVCLCVCVRYMMYIRKEDEVYMVDRDNAVFLIPKVKFFNRHNLEQHLKDTLVDGVRDDAGILVGGVVGGVWDERHTSRWKYELSDWSEH